jgi:hypothetical protein
MSEAAILPNERPDAWQRALRAGVALSMIAKQVLAGSSS